MRHMVPQSNIRGTHWTRTKYFRNVLIFMILLGVVAATIVFGGNNATEDDYGFDTELYFGMTILRGWPIESILPLEPELTGYTFLHWSSTPDGEGFDFSAPVLNEMTFYAIWAEGSSGANYGLDEVHYEHEIYNYGDAFAYDYYPIDDYNIYYGDDDDNNDMYIGNAPTYTYYMAYEDSDVYGYDNDYQAHERDETYPRDDNHNTEINNDFEINEEDKIFVRFNWNHENHLEILRQEAAEAERIHEARMQLDTPHIYDEAFAAGEGYIHTAPVEMIETLETEGTPETVEMPEVEMFGGYIPIMPFNATVSNLAGLRQQISNRTGNNTQWTIYLNWGTINSIPADLAITIPANTNINLQSASAARPTWNQQLTGQRHFLVRGTLTIGNIQLSRVSQDSTVIGGGIQVLGGGNLYVNHGGALLQNNHALQGGAIDIVPGARATIRGGTFTGNLASGSGIPGVEGAVGGASGGGIRVSGSVLGSPTHTMGYLTFTRQYPTFVSDNHQTASVGGGVVAANGATIIISGDQPLYITDNTATTSGGGLTAGGHLHISGSGPLNIRDNTAGTSGGGVVLSGHNGLLGFTYVSPLTPIDISRNTATNGHGGGIEYARGNIAAVDFDENINTLRLSANVTITNNNARDDGGGIAAHSGAVVLNNTTITHNTAGINGGGIAMTNGNIVSNGVIIHSNTASAAVGIPTTANTGGGGVSISGAAGVFTMNSGTIGHPDAIAINTSSNRAIRGAGVRVLSGTFNFNGGSILYNVTTNVEDGTTALADGRGGGVFIDAAGNFNMSGEAATDRLIRNNAADLGGGVYLRNGNLRIENENAHIQANTVTTAASGAGIHQIAGTVTMSAGSIRNHNATGTPEGGVSNGSGVDMRGGTFNMSGGAITSNRTGAANMPGGINVEGGSIFNMTGTSTIGGSTENMWNQGTTGGGVRVATTEGLFFPPFIVIPGGSFNMENGVGESGIRAISHNQVTGTGATNGGGGVFIETGHFRMENTATSIVEANIVNNANVGAGVHQIGGTVTMSGANTHIRNHNEQGTAAGMGPSHGSGVDIRGGVFNMSAGYISSNRTAAANRPGGVNVEDSGTFNMSDTSTVMWNQGTMGGGVRVNGAVPTFTFTGGTIGGPRGCDDNCPDHANPLNCDTDQGNIANSGGGVWIGGDASFYMQDHNLIVPGTGLIIGNSATTAGSGGGVMVTGANSTFDMSAGTIEDNLAPGPASVGGGVAVIQGAHMDLSGDALIHHNESTFMGGGGVALLTNATMDMSGGTIEYNRAVHGGGIGTFTNSDLDISGGIIRNNTALHGGGIEVNGGLTLTMTGGYIYNNTATGNGGGVWVMTETANHSSFIMHAGTIGGPRGCPSNCTVHANSEECDSDQGNRAVNGGGVWVGDRASFSLTGGGAKRIIGNNANFGGGVFVAWTSDTNRGQMRMQPLSSNLHITHNVAVHDGGGIFTQNHQYEDPLEMMVPPVPYANLTILLGTLFTGNSASASFIPPSNASATGIPNMANSTSHIHPINNYDINFGSPPFVFQFTKTRDNGVTHLPGAVFRLDRWNETLGDWVAVPAATQPNGNPTTSAANGSVSFELERDQTLRYRIVEVSAPEPFQQTIPGYWVIRFRHLYTLSVEARGGNPNMIIRNGNYYLPNRLYPEWDFDFIKTDNPYAPADGDELDGAIFHLYRWNPALENGAGDWEHIPGMTQTSNTDGEVSFTLPGTANPLAEIPEWAIPGTQFKLREVAPEGFVQPPGHWIVTPTFNYAMQRVDFEVTRVLGTGESAGVYVITPDFVNHAIVGASGQSIALDGTDMLLDALQGESEPVPAAIETGSLSPAEAAERFAYFEELGILEVVDGGVILHAEQPESPFGIQPFNQTLAPGATWEALRAAVTNATQSVGGVTPYTITIQGHITAVDGAGIIGNSIAVGVGTVPGTARNVIIQSNGANNWTLLQTNAEQRHFNVSGGSRLTLQNITLSGDQQNVSHNHGGVHVQGASGLHSRLYLNLGSVITNNRAITGGGVQAVGGAGAATATINGGHVLNNRATTGGGVTLGNATGTLIMNSGRIAYNEVLDSGGGVQLPGSSNMYMHGGVIEENIASRSGGIHAGTAAAIPVDLTITGGYIRHNQSTLDTDANVSGGGIAVFQNINVEITGGRIYGNSTAYKGGGINVFTSLAETHTLNFNMTGGYIHDNHAALDGGGIYTNRHLYNDPLDYEATGVYDNINIGPGVTFFGNTARGWFRPPTIINTPVGTTAGQLPNIEWIPAVGSSVPASGGGYLYLLNNYDINFVGQTGLWYLGNQEKFRFVKTNSISNPHQGLRLPDAQFQLYWRPDTNSAWQARGNAASSSVLSTLGIVQLPLTQVTGQYRLVETIAPSGFQTPFGYWLIEPSRINTRLAVAIGDITEHDGNPAFVQHPALTGNMYVGNRSDFELPLAGGSGSGSAQRNALFTLAGSTVIGAAGLVGMLILRARKRKFVNPRYSNKG